MEIYTRVILQPRGGGEPLETFYSAEDPQTEVDTILSSYTQRFGPPFEVAFATSPDIEGPINIGWLFDLPSNFEVPGPLEQFEMVLIPMVDDPETGQRINLFERMAEQRADFQRLFDSGRLAEFHSMTLSQRNPDEPPRSERSSQRRDGTG